jgi:hypothetical protein
MRDICDKNRDKKFTTNIARFLKTNPPFSALSERIIASPIASPAPSYHDKCPVAPSNLPSPLALPLPEIATCCNSYHFYII